MEDVNISKFRAQVVRAGSTPASPGFVVSEGQNPVDPSGSGQNHLPVTIATVSTGLSITESQILSGAGLVSQYIRGDGSLADFPATTGGGSSVSYYLNGSVSQGTIGGVAYREVNRTPIFGAGTDITINADGYIASFITDALDPNKLLIPAGNWNLETYFSASSSGGSPSFYVELYKYNGTTFTLIATSSSAPELIAFGTNLNPYYSTLAVPETVLALTDRLALRYYVTHSGRTITLHTENNHLCQVITTFTTGLTALNGLTSQVQYLTVGTSGTDFAISSATDTHTFNLPTASATNRGALSSADWTTFNNKTSNLGTVTSVGLSSATSGVTIGSTPITTSGTITLAIATASGSQNGLLSSTDWTTFNSKQNALTNPVTGTGANGQVAYFTGTSAISSESSLFWNSTNDRLGIGLNNPDSILHIFGSGSGNSLTFTKYTCGDGGDIRIGKESGVNNDAIFGTWSNNAVIFYANSAEAMRMFASRNLHIGPTPASDNGARLQVSGTASFTGALTGTSATFTGNILLSGSGAYVRASTTNGFLVNNNNDSLNLFIVTNAGNVGIGTTNPTTKLHVETPTGNDQVARFSRGPSNAGDIMFGLGDYGGGYQSRIGALQLAFEVNRVNGAGLDTGTTAMFIKSSGNVLIGTTTDNGAKLQLFNSGTATQLIITGGDTSNQRLEVTDGTVTNRFGIFGRTNGDAGVIGTQTNHPLVFNTNNSERMRINALGFLKASNNAVYESASGGYHEFNQSNSGSTVLIATHRASDPYGIELQFKGADPNNASNYVFGAYTTSGSFAWIYRIFSNGTVSARSDARWKKNIETTRSGYIDDLCKLRVVKYNWYNHEDNAPKELGLIAQEVEEVFPNLIQHDTVTYKREVKQEDGTFVEEEFEDGTSRSIKVSVLPYMLLKAIQEQQKQIEELKSKLS